MPVENSEDRYATLKDNEVDQIWEAMHNRHPNVIEHDWKPERLLLNRGVGGSDFLREFVSESSASRLVPRERLHDIGLRSLPNEQVRHYAPRLLSS
jgi:glucose-6-phosphate isomerase